MARAAVSLLVGLLVARGLGPADYGNLAYLLGSFWAIRALLDMGASSAFFTFIAQSKRDNRYYFLYFGWLAFQFFLSLALVAVLLPHSVIDRFWLGQERDLILIALLATFLQNQVWQTLVQMHEAERKSVRIQIAGLSVITLHLVLVSLMLLGDILQVQTVLLAIIGEYCFAAAWLFLTMRRSTFSDGSTAMPATGDTLKPVALEYFHYCRPMIVIAVFTFFYEITDRWLLQRFGGASQQGFFQVASQLSMVSLLATSSILNIFWKEIAEASERGETTRVVALYQKTTHGLVFLASAVSCFLAPWSEHLVEILLGNAYKDAWPVLLLMLFYPIHQSVGQINSTMFMATARNSVYMKITVVGLLAGIPVSYVLVAPQEGLVISGFELGAMGLALKIVGLNIFFVNVQSWLICRHYRSTFQWHHQILVILLLLAIAYGCRIAGESLTQYFLQFANNSRRASVLMGIASSGLGYLFCVFALVIRKPGIAGMRQHEVMSALDRVIFIFRLGK